MLLDVLMLLDDLGNSKVAELDSLLIVKKHVIKFDVSVKHRSTVAVPNSIGYLLEDVFGLFFWQSLLPLNVVK